jgi:uncharacterized membrane protein YfcA
MIALGILTALYLFWWWRSHRRQEGEADKSLPSLAQLAIGFGANFFDTLGIGHYAPSLVLFSLLGMDLHAAFPLMAGAGAFAGVIASLRFLHKGCINQRAALGLTLGGIPAVLLAALVVKSLPLDVLRWLVVVVIVYTAFAMLRAARNERTSAQVVGGK